MLIASLGPIDKGIQTVDLMGQQGTAWDLSIQVFQDEENTVPLDLNGYSARGQFRKSYNGGLVFAFECSIDLTGNANTVNIHLDPATSSASTVYAGVYDIEVYTSNDEDVKRIMEGSLVIDREVTK